MTTNSKLRSVLLRTLYTIRTSPCQSFPSSSSPPSVSCSPSFSLTLHQTPSIASSPPGPVPPSPRIHSSALENKLPPSPPSSPPPSISPIKASVPEPEVSASITSSSLVSPNHLPAIPSPEISFSSPTKKATSSALSPCVPSSCALHEPLDHQLDIQTHQDRVLIRALCVLEKVHTNPSYSTVMRWRSHRALRSLFEPSSAAHGGGTTSLSTLHHRQASLFAFRSPTSVPKHTPKKQGEVHGPLAITAETMPIQGEADHGLDKANGIPSTPTSPVSLASVFATADTQPIREDQILTCTLPPPTPNANTPHAMTPSPSFPPAAGTLDHKRDAQSEDADCVVEPLRVAGQRFYA